MGQQAPKNPLIFRGLFVSGRYVVGANSVENFPLYTFKSIVGIFMVSVFFVTSIDRVSKYGIYNNIVP